MKFLVSLALVCVVALPGFGAAQPAPQSAAGAWDATYSTPGGPRSFRVVLVVDGAKLTGTVKREAGDSPLAGTVKDDAVQFSYTILYNGNALELTVAAKISGDSMKGTVDFGGGATEEFNAKRVPGSAPKPADRAM